MVSKVAFVISVILMVFVLPLSSSLAASETLNVEGLIKEALQNNPEILAAKAKWQVYKEKVPQAYGLEDPMLGFGIVSLPTNFSFKDEDMTMKEFSISQKLPFPGKRPLMKGMAEREAEAVSTDIQGKGASGHQRYQDSLLRTFPCLSSHRGDSKKQGDPGKFCQDR